MVKDFLHAFSSKTEFDKIYNDTSSAVLPSVFDVKCLVSSGDTGETWDTLYGFEFLEEYNIEAFWVEPDTMPKAYIYSNGEYYTLLGLEESVVGVLLTNVKPLNNLTVESGIDKNIAIINEKEYEAVKAALPLGFAKFVCVTDETDILYMYNSSFFFEEIPSFLCTNGSILPGDLFEVVIPETAEPIEVSSYYSPWVSLTKNVTERVVTGATDSEGNVVLTYLGSKRVKTSSNSGSSGGIISPVRSISIYGETETIYHRWADRYGSTYLSMTRFPMMWSELEPEESSEGGSDDPKKYEAK